MATLHDVIGPFLLSGGAVGVMVLPLVKTDRTNPMIAVVFMAAAGVGAILYCLFGGTFRWGRTGIPMADWLGRILMGSIGVSVLYFAWKIWHG